ncbi:MAG: Uncharacterized protein G01um101438_476 [Parcubacteria group bacterium Gr01-1014_38]|nr:MAG: Uncharacterized protein G01um101438_476 [Parcubacteria group bacterium Gr01-1014_38]
MGREPSAEGPLVCDLFCGEYPRRVSHLVVLPKVLPTRFRSEPDALLSRVVSPVVPSPPPQRLQREERSVGREEVLRELQDVLAQDAHRTTALFQDVRRLRVSVHAERTRSRNVSTVPAEAARAQHVHARSFTPPASPPRKPRVKIREAFRVGVGALTLGGFIALAASAGTLPQMTLKVRGSATQGATALHSGIRSLLTADAHAGRGSFAEAQRAFREASEELAASVTVAQRIVGAVDPAGRLSRVEALLRAGEQLARLGQEASAIVGEFQHGNAALTDALEALSPKLATLDRELKDIRKQLAGIPLDRLAGAEAEEVREVVQNVEFLNRAIENFLTSEEVVLELLGARQDRQYLVLFQNNRELRPTGGFIGSFALMDVSRGQVRKIHADTIYNPDGQLKDFLLPPQPLRKITDRWYARDANWFADFRVSAAKVAQLFEHSGGPTVDGVLAVTPLVLEELLRLTGPIPMPDYEVTVTAENVVEETQRLVTYDYDRQQNQPKAFIADLLPEVLARVASLPRERWGELVEAFIHTLRSKHLLVYFRDDAAEASVLALGWGGALPQMPPARPNIFVDHLGRVEANIGGHKTDDLIEQSVEYDVTMHSENRATATLVVTRHHRGSRHGTPGVKPEEDPARKPNVIYERTFVPPRSELIEARGFVRAATVPSPFTAGAYTQPLTADPDLQALERRQEEHDSGVFLGEESGLTTFGGWVITAPEETTVTVLRYRLPFQVPPPSLLASVARYELFLTHQPGHLPVPLRVTLRVPEGFRVAWSGPASMLTEVGDRKVRYQGALDRDLTWGAVIEER